MTQRTGLNTDAVMWAFAREVGDPLAKFLLCTIAAGVREDDRCRTSVVRLSRACEISVQRVIRKLHLLEERGLIAKTPGPPTRGAPGEGKYDFRLRRGEG